MRTTVPTITGNHNLQELWQTQAQLEIHKRLAGQVGAEGLEKL